MAVAGPAGPPVLLAAPNGPFGGQYDGWSRPAVRDWLLRCADANEAILIGFDFSAGFPFVDQNGYFPGWTDSPPDARSLWRAVDMMSAGDDSMAATAFLQHPGVHRHFRHGGGVTGDAFGGGIGRLRVVEQHQRTTRQASSASCFNLVGAAQVGKASLAGMRLLHQLGGAIPVWPFDPIPAAGPMIAEIYTSMAARAAGLRAGISKIRDIGGLNAALGQLGSAPLVGHGAITDHAADALLTAAWLRHMAGSAHLWTPALLSPDIARTEGWTFGVI